MSAERLPAGKPQPAQPETRSRGRCPACGRRSPRRSSRPSPAFPRWEAGELEQLVESMDLGEIAGLLGISRWELERRCRSLGIHIRGANEVEE